MAITIENTWWNEGGLWEDSDLKRVKLSLLHYRPEPFSPEECTKASVLTLRGPRRAGKTVALKLLVAKLIEKKGWLPQQIVWTVFDTMRTLSQAEEHLCEIQKRYSPRLLIVDEITTVLGWQRVIKKLRDDGTFSQTCLILTGSSAYDLKSGAERMAGRRGDVEHPDRVLLPMSYLEFCKQLEHNGLTETKDWPTKFLEVGGFPFRIENFLKAKTKWNPLNAFQVFDDVVFYEFNRRKLDRNIALEILGRLTAIGNTAVSYESFSKALSVAKDTARKYLDALGDAFLLATIFSYDTGRSRVASKKDKKFIWIDPALGFLGQHLQQGEAAQEDQRVEWCVGAELIRRFEVRLWEGLSAPRNVYTWKSSGGNEIDFLLVNKTAKLLFPVEVKFQKTISDWDFQILERAFQKGWIVTPDTDRKRPNSEALSFGKFCHRILEMN